MPTTNFAIQLTNKGIAIALGLGTCENKFAVIIYGMKPWLISLFPLSSKYHIVYSEFSKVLVTVSGSASANAFIDICFSSFNQ